MDNFIEIYNDVSTSSSDEINIENISEFVLKIIQLTEKIKCDGPTKKIVAMSVINKLIVETKMENMDAFLEISNLVVPNMIDCFIDVDNRKKRIKEKKEKERNRCCLYWPDY